MEDQKKPNPMYFASIKLKNVKSFGEEQILNLTDESGAVSPWTLILGDNGVGKTTLLKCLAWMVPVQFAEPERFQLARKLKAKEEEKKEEEEKDIKWIKEFTKLTDKEWEIILNENPGIEEVKRMTPLLDSIDEDDINAIIRAGKGVRMNIEAAFTDNIPLNTIPDEKNLMTIGISLARKDDEKLDEIEDILNTDHLKTAKVEEFNAPNLFAYSAARHMAPENFETLEKDPTYNLFSASGDLYDAGEVLSELYTDSVVEQNTLLKEENEQLKNDSTQPSINEVQKENINKKSEGKATKYLQKVKEILTKLLPHIDNPDCIIINPSNKKEGPSKAKIVEVVTPFGKVGLYDLSLGYQTMLAWVVDLAIRMFWQNPESENPLKEPAVVIVDEIDLHLHPKWQRTLKEYLTGNFTATQFICTAHSPFMAQASEDENLSVLHEIKLTPIISEVKIDNDPTIVKGWRIGQIIKSDLFGVPETSFKIEKWRDERREILDKPEQTPANKIRLEELNEELSKLPSTENNETQKLLNQIRVTAEILKKEGKLK